MVTHPMINGPAFRMALVAADQAKELFYSMETDREAATRVMPVAEFAAHMALVSIAESLDKMARLMDERT
jgi:hypothetical protein